MAAVRPRRARVRRALLVLASLVAAILGSMALGPVLTAPRIADQIAAARPTPAPVPRVRDEAYAGLGPTSSPPTRQPVSIIAIRPPEPTGLTATPAMRHALQARLDQLRERYGVPGISVTILFPDGSSWLGASGLADVTAKRAVTPSTSFAIASVSKTFTGALVVALAQEGKVDLDASVRRYLPDLKVNIRTTVCATTSSTPPSTTRCSATRAGAGWPPTP
jgi:CubicO group peptidase (beta-lactamase class C family)